MVRTPKRMTATATPNCRPWVTDCIKKLPTLLAPSGKAVKASSVPARAMKSTARTTYISAMDSAVATIESRRKRRPSGSLRSSVEGDIFLPLPPTSLPTPPAAKYPAVPKCPMATESSPVMRRVNGWAIAGSETIRMPSRAAPKGMTTQDEYPAGASTIVRSVAIKRTWCPVRNT